MRGPTDWTLKNGQKTTSLTKHVKNKSTFNNKQKQSSFLELPLRLSGLPAAAPEFWKERSEHLDQRKLVIQFKFQDVSPKSCSSWKLL